MRNTALKVVLADRGSAPRVGTGPRGRSRPGGHRAAGRRRCAACGHVAARPLRAPQSLHDLGLQVRDQHGRPAEASQTRELLTRIIGAIALLTPHQREVLLALAVDGVPIDVLADRLSTNRNALYKTLHDARTRLRGLLDDEEIVQ